MNRIPAQLVAADTTNDLAILRIDTTSPTPYLRFRSTPPRLAEPVVALGYPLPSILSPTVTASTGTVSALSGLGGDTRLIQINSPIQPGNSGGPVVDDQGQVVGVIVGKLNVLKVARVTGDLPQNVNFAIGLRSVQTFLESRGVGYSTGQADKRDLVVASEQGAKSTIQVFCTPQP